MKVSLFARPNVNRKRASGTIRRLFMFDLPSLSPQGNSEATVLVLLQSWLVAVTNDNLEETKTRIVDSVFMKENGKQVELVHCLMNMLIYRPQKVPVVAKLVELILNSEQSKKTKLRDLILRSIAGPSNYDYSQMFAYREFIKLGVFSGEEIVSQITAFYSHFPSAQINHLILFCWFTPEIEKYDPSHFQLLLNLSHSTDLLHSRPDIFHFFENLERFRENNYSLWYQCMSFNDQPDSLTWKLRNDDIDFLKEQTSSEGFDINQRIPPFILGVSSFLTCYPTLIQYAAFFGSVKCFKHLLENHANISLSDYCNSTLSHFAVAGGNLEIINILENKISFAGCLSTATKFHQNDIFKWLKEHMNIDLSKSDLKDLAPIHYAAESGNIEALIECLKADVDVNLCFESGWTPLHLAARHGQFSIIRLLSSHNDIKINLKDAKGWTALHWASTNSHPKSIRALLEHQEIKINDTDSDGQTPLHWAAIKGYPEAVHVLLAKKDIIDVNIRNNEGSSPLHMASMKGHYEIVQELCSFEGIDINTRDYSEASPLYLACENGHFQVVELLLSCPGINVNLQDNFGETPLFAASSSNNEHKAETIAALLQSPEIDVNKVNSRGATSLHVCAENGDRDAISLLISRPELKMDTKDNFGWTPLHSASSVGNNEAIEILLQHPEIDPNFVDDSGKTALFWAIGAARTESDFGDPLRSVELLLPLTDINIKNSEGQTALHFAMTIFSEQIISLLLSSPMVEINAQDNEGNTPLHIAAREQNNEAVELLLNKEGINPMILNSMDRTALHVCALSGTDVSLEILLRLHNFDINLRDKAGSTPLMLAVESGSVEKVQILVSVPNIDINATDGNGRSPRVNALRKGFTTIASIISKARTL